MEEEAGRRPPAQERGRPLKRLTQVVNIETAPLALASKHLQQEEFR